MKMTEEEAIKLLESIKNGEVNIVSKNDDDFDWRTLLETCKNGNPKPTYENHKIVFEYAIKRDLKYNDFERVTELDGKALNDTSIAILRNEFENKGKFRNQQVTRDFLLQYSYERKYNPIKNYLENLKWDGKKRASTLFIDWLNVEDTPVNRKLAEKWLVSGIKRIYEPGCAIEGMIVLVGQQGNGKSTLIKRLGKNKYSIEAIVDLRNEKNCVETFNRAWIVNFDELKSIVKADSDLAKAVLTRQSDTARLAYREESETYDRHCIFIGATNDTSILKDYSDKVERRYWMMQCNQTDKHYIYDNFTDEIVDQIWAEAYQIYINNRDYNISISDFDDDEFNDIYKTQRAFKSFNGDDLTNDLIELLDQKYYLNEQNEFKSKDDFVQQALGKKEFDEHTLFNRINAIPFSYINYYLSSTKKTGRGNDYIVMMLEDKWRVVERYTYKNSRLKCLVRKDID